MKSKQRRTGRIPAAIVLSLLTAMSGLTMPAAANAAPPADVIQGDWAAGTPVAPATIEPGARVEAKWVYELADAASAPENVTVTFTAQHAVFTELPEFCLVTDVDPVSEISPDSRSLVCNLGTLEADFTEFTLAGIAVDSVSGETVSVAATLGVPDAALGEPSVNEPTLTLPELVLASPLRGAEAPAVPQPIAAPPVDVTPFAAPPVDDVTTVYEIQGEWVDIVPPGPVVSGSSVGAKWFYNINDSDPVPNNPPHDNVTVTFTAVHAKFTAVPYQCLTTGVTPVSAISADKKTLTCNVGTRDLGSAELFITGVVADGKTGDKMSMSAKVGEPGVNEVSATLPELDFNNPFKMDMKFDAGNPRSQIGTPGTEQFIRFPWSLRHAPGSSDGPDSVSYDLTLSGANPISTQASVACVPQNNPNPGHPYSGPGHDADQTAPFVGTCTLVPIAGANKFRLTLTGIDYSKTTLPAHGTDGVALPSDWDVVAAGEINFKFTYTSATTINLSASTPTYTSVASETFTDLAANNTNSAPAIRGVWSGGWGLDAMNPPQPGTIWTDTYRTMQGQPVLQRASARASTTSGKPTRLCSILDTKYVTFESSAVGNLVDGAVQPYPNSGPITYQYYTGNGQGNMVNPASGSYNPNDFRCDGSTDGGTAWTSTLPADLSTVKAIRAVVPYTVDVTDPRGIAVMSTFSRIKTTTPIGMDVWAWTSVMIGDTTSWINHHRETTPGSVPGSGTLTPGARYPFAAAGRDVLRIVAGTPFIEKEVAQPVTQPGAVVDFTLTYRVDAMADVNVDNVIIKDILPAGLSYVSGSATPAPSSVAGQTLTWNFDGVATNTDYTILLKATVTGSATPGQSFENAATAKLGNVTKEAKATTRVGDGGYTSVKKTATAQTVPHVGGVANDGWTVELTSHDTSASAWTDTVDVLPYNGDGRGTDFQGSYVLSGPVTAAAGATVYYTTTAPASLNDDPAHASNGAAGTIAGNTVGWSTTYTAGATAVRVIGPALAPSTSQAFTIDVVTTGTTGGDVYVNRAEARAERTKLKMRTSDWFTVEGVTLAWEKVDSSQARLAGSEWSLTPVDAGGTPTGAALAVTDCVAATPAGCTGLDTDNTAGGFMVDLPAAGRWMLVETAAPAGYVLDATPHYIDAVQGDNAFAAAFVNELIPSGLTWTKVNEAPVADQVRLAGSEWELTPVDAADAPTGPALAVVDCVEATPAGCTGLDTDNTAGGFRIDPLAAGRWMLVETKAPAGYVLDATPHFIEVSGDTAFSTPFVNVQSTVPQIPLTGGIGTFSILLGGGLAAALALLLVGIRRRRALGL